MMATRGGSLPSSAPTNQIEPDSNIWVVVVVGMQRRSHHWVKAQRVGKDKGQAKGANLSGDVINSTLAVMAFTSKLCGVAY
jgi:hypothetical protein